MSDLFSETRSLKECVNSLEMYENKFASLRYNKMRYSLKFLKEDMLNKIEQIENILKELRNDKKDN